MIFTVQTDEIRSVKEAVKSDCQKIRFGSEFCEWKIPRVPEIKKAYNDVKNGKKEFAFITPRASNKSLSKIREHFTFLNSKTENEAIVNDLGVLDLSSEYPEVVPHLGRQLIHIPARCPWIKPDLKDNFLLNIFKLSSGEESLYSQTSLNFKSTMRFYRELGVKGIDLDLIPRCFPYYNSLSDAGFKTAIHLDLIPVSITRKCHTARFLGEKEPEKCSRPCNSKIFQLNRSGLETQLYLSGNSVFRVYNPAKRLLKKFSKKVPNEFVISMNPLTKIRDSQSIDEIIRSLEEVL
jgi:hypothetical protein